LANPNIGTAKIKHTAKAIKYVNGADLPAWVVVKAMV